MALVIVTPAAAEPVTVEEAKEFLRVDGDDENVLIGGLIAAARQSIDGRDGWLGRALLTQTWDLVLDRFPYWYRYPGFAANLAPVGGYSNYRDDGQDIVVPLPPLQSVTSITYVDTTGATQTLSSSLYTVDNKHEPGRIVPAYGTTWPATRAVMNAVTVRFVAGWADANAVPEGIKLGIKALVAHWFENREAAGSLLAPLPMHVDQLLANYRKRIPEHTMAHWSAA